MKLDWHFTATSHGVRTTWTSCEDVRAKLEDVKASLEAIGFTDVEFTGKSWPPYAWPGGYEIAYIAADGGLLCHQCANSEIDLTSDPDAEDDWRIVASEINYESTDMYCAHCDRQIKPAYGDPDETSD